VPVNTVFFLFPNARLSNNCDRTLEQRPPRVQDRFKYAQQLIISVGVLRVRLSCRRTGERLTTSPVRFHGTVQTTCCSARFTVPPLSSRSAGSAPLGEEGCMDHTPVMSVGPEESSGRTDSTEIQTNEYCNASCSSLRTGRVPQVAREIFDRGTTGRFLGRPTNAPRPTSVFNERRKTETIVRGTVVVVYDILRGGDVAERERERE